MLYIPYAATLWFFAQNPSPAQPAVQPPATGVSAPAKAGAPAATATKPPEEKDSEFDKFVRAQSERIDKLVDVSAEFTQMIRNQDQEILTTGVFKTGPKHRLRMEISPKTIGGVVSRRMYVSNGSLAFLIVQVGEDRQAEQYKLDQILPLLNSKELNDDERNFMLGRVIPFERPGEMLRGFLRRITFTKREDEKLGEKERTRDVVRLEGQWRRSAIASMIPGKQNPTINDIGGDGPQFMDLILDKQTGWPLQIDLFRRDPAVGVYKPHYSFKFTKLTIGERVPDADFAYVPPAKTTVRDKTPERVNDLKRYLELKAADAAKKATKPATPQPTN